MWMKEQSDYSSSKYVALKIYKTTPCSGSWAVVSHYSPS